MLSRVFYAHGELCASHPWEVIVALLTLTVCLLTVDQRPVALNTIDPLAGNDCSWRRPCNNEEYNAADMIMMTIIRCIAILYSYYQFCNLHKLGSKYIFGIAGLFTVFSSFVFSSTVINFMSGDTSALKDAIFFFLLLIDLSKATLLAQIALSAPSPDEVKTHIAHGMLKLGPTITLDTLVEALVIGVGTLSGVKRLEVLCTFACMSVVVNYLVFMTFYPACLSLTLDLSRISAPWQRLKLIAKLTEAEDQKPNPVVQRVKIIMSMGLLLVHARSRWPASMEEDEDLVSPLAVLQGRDLPMNKTEESELHASVMRWVTINADHIVVLILLLALTLKVIIFEEDENHSLSSPKNSGKFILNPIVFDKESQTVHTSGTKTVINSNSHSTDEELEVLEETEPRNLSECTRIFKEDGPNKLSDVEIMLLVSNGIIQSYQLETAVKNPVRGVQVRRKILADSGSCHEALLDLPFENYDYSKVMGACCENVIGYVPVPVGVAGPLLLDGRLVYVPMATTEGCLVASTNRGSRALMSCGVTTRVVADGMTRGPVIRFPSMAEASEAMLWMEREENFVRLKSGFDSSSRFARLVKIHVRIAGRNLFVRFVATTGDAMGMNMLSKGTEAALEVVREHFPDMELLSLSGNFCSDKKPAAVNWIEGRGKSVVAEAIVPAKVVRAVLKTTVRALVDVNITKNLVGSAVAGSMGGFNAHAANIVTAVYIATGQDPAQNVASSSCITLMEPWGEKGEDLYMSCSMPSIEVGTVGGGTVLPAQSACLSMLGVKGSHETCPGENASSLARIVCGTVLAGELSLMSALAAGHLVRSHLRHNRSSANVTSAATCISS